MSQQSEKVKEHIELAIDRARDGVGETIDEIDRRLRDALDVKKQARDHAPQLMVAGVTVGLLVGLGAGKTIVRALQFGIPIALAFKVARSKIKSADVFSAADDVMP